MLQLAAAAPKLYMTLLMLLLHMLLLEILVTRFIVEVTVATVVEFLMSEKTILLTTMAYFHRFLRSDDTMHSLQSHQSGRPPNLSLKLQPPSDFSYSKYRRAVVER